MTLVPLAAAVLLWLLISRLATVRRWLRVALSGVPARALAIALVLAAILVAARGNLWAAFCLFGLSLWALGRARTVPPAAKPRHRRSLTIEMVEASAGARLRGRAIAGPFAGRDLDALDRAGCERLYADCLRADPMGARLLEPYLHGRFAGWGEARQTDADFGGRRARSAGAMTEEQAYQVLGLRRGASRDDVVRSHRSAMKRWHPDQGGTAELAARANEAKEVLLRRHG